MNGRSYELERPEVVSRLAGVSPERIQRHAVNVGGVWYPVRQAFEVATGRPRSEFTSQTARRHLTGLGFEVRGDVHHREESAKAHGSPRRGDAQATPSSAAHEWHTEADVQSLLVNVLVREGWAIRSVADTATKERGIDVVAARDGQITGIEVKGFPSRHYADPRRAGETKKTQPSTQAGHWYAQAVLAAMRLRSREPEWRSVIALPNFARYRTLYEETVSSLDAAKIEVWWVSEDGSLRIG